MNQIFIPVTLDQMEVLAEALQLYIASIVGSSEVPAVTLLSALDLSDLIAEKGNAAQTSDQVYLPALGRAARFTTLNKY